MRAVLIETLSESAELRWYTHAVMHEHHPRTDGLSLPGRLVVSYARPYFSFADRPEGAVLKP